MDVNPSAWPALSAEVFRLDNVPITKMETLKSFGFRLGKSKIGSLQLYVPDAESAAKALEIKRFWCFYPSRGRKNLERNPELLEKIPQEIFEADGHSRFPHRPA